MSNDFRTQIYNTLNLKETDELLEIWETNDRVDWSELTFDVVREILQQRLGEVPPQNKPAHEHVKPGAEDDNLDVYEISPQYQATSDRDESGVKIEFQGFYGKETLRKKKALVRKQRLTPKQTIVKIIVFIFLVVSLVLSCAYIIQSKQYFSRYTIAPLVILGVLYKFYIQPFIDSAYSDQGSSSDNSRFCQGFISADGIRFIAVDQLTQIPWDKIYRAKRTQNLIVLFAEYISPMAFPCNFFKSKADWQQFRNWVDDYVKQPEK